MEGKLAQTQKTPQGLAAANPKLYAQDVIKKQNEENAKTIRANRSDVRTQGSDDNGNCLTTIVKIAVCEPCAGLCCPDEEDKNKKHCLQVLLITQAAGAGVILCGTLAQPNATAVIFGSTAVGVSTGIELIWGGVNIVKSSESECCTTSASDNPNLSAITTQPSTNIQVPNATITSQPSTSRTAYVS